MNERFVIDDKIVLDEDKVETYQIRAIVDTQTKNFYFVIDDLANIKTFVERLNALSKENAIFKTDIESLSLLLNGIKRYIHDMEMITNDK